jgi:hypothetical protein
MFINEGQARLGYPLESYFDLKAKVHCKWRIMQSELRRSRETLRGVSIADYA